MRFALVVVALVTMGFAVTETVSRHPEPAAGPQAVVSQRAYGPAFVTSGIEVLLRPGW